jgi:hypothetical protein
LIAERVLMGLDLLLLLVLSLWVAFGGSFQPGESDAESHTTPGGEEGW